MIEVLYQNYKIRCSFALLVETCPQWFFQGYRRKKKGPGAEMKTNTNKKKNKVKKVPAS